MRHARLKPASQDTWHHCYSFYIDRAPPRPALGRRARDRFGALCPRDDPPLPAGGPGRQTPPGPGTRPPPSRMPPSSAAGGDCVHGPTERTFSSHAGSSTGCNPASACRAGTLVLSGPFAGAPNPFGSRVPALSPSTPSPTIRRYQQTNAGVDCQVHFLVSARSGLASRYVPPLRACPRHRSFRHDLA